MALFAVAQAIVPFVEVKALLATENAELAYELAIIVLFAAVFAVVKAALA